MVGVAQTYSRGGFCRNKVLDEKPLKSENNLEPQSYSFLLVVLVLVSCIWHKTSQVKPDLQITRTVLSNHFGLCVQDLNREVRPSEIVVPSP